MTQSNFRKKHPGFDVQVLHGSEKHFCAVATDKQHNVFATACAKTEKEALDNLSRHVLALLARRVAREQGQRDANTGEVAPLQAHHKVKRSAGGKHARENLAGVSERTHAKQHEGKKKP